MLWTLVAILATVAVLLGLVLLRRRSRHLSGGYETRAESPHTIDAARQHIASTRELGKPSSNVF
jgi:hypothetical protein